ncbi:MAG: AMP-binding protein [Candidatus Eisenbacteria bacterium]|uniref:Phenylacetate--CoA ligase family protein n=1 Tax=Eiseniibacteriota bacterium TaxID=2212470 RepID=A0A956LX65_UNCEI|nr:phenylacetate--CoA ligase family protein [Candidatus Eisenbacteria bacterium]
MAIDFRVRDFFHPVRILRLHRDFERHQWEPLSAVRAYQIGRLRAVLSVARDHVPFYRELFARVGFDPSALESDSDLAALPLLTRDVVREHQAAMRADDAHRLGAIVQRTSGTTGRPIEFLADAESQSLEFVYYWRHWSWAGYRLGDRFAELGSQFFLRRSDDAIACWQPGLRRLMLDSTRVSAENARPFADAIRRHRPRFLKGMPSAVHLLAESLRDAGIDDLRFRAVFTNGEPVTASHRASVERVFGCRVLDSYGHMERTVAISQCLEGEYHVHPDYGLLQLVESGAPTGRPGTSHEEKASHELSDSVRAAEATPRHAVDDDGGSARLPRRARVIGTSLHNRAMPFVRYELGDQVELYSEPRTCRCGRSFPVVKRILGRSRDVVVTPDGRHISTLFMLPEMVEGALLTQFVQESPRELRIRVAPGPGWSESSERQMREYAQRLVGPSMRVDVECVPGEQLLDESGKLRTVVSHL